MRLFCSSSRLPIDRDPHAPGRTLDDLRRAIQVGGVQVRHLGSRYLLDLRAAHGADLLSVRLAAAPLDVRGLLEQECRRGRLGDEGERAVLVDRDLHGDHLAHLVARGVVELPHELPDVHLRLTQSRADRRRRVRLATGYLQLQLARDAPPAPSTHKTPLSLELGYLVEGELDRRLAPEDRDQNLQPRLVHVYIRDGAGEVRERPADDLDRLPDLVVYRGLDLLAALDLCPAERRRLLPRPDDLGDPRRLPHDLPGVLVHVHVDEDVAGELALDGGHLLAVLDLDDALGRDTYLPEVSPRSERLDPALQRRADLVLVTRVCIDHVPLLQKKRS